jgi:hypothetical protein
MKPTPPRVIALATRVDKVTASRVREGARADARTPSGYLAKLIRKALDAEERDQHA